MYRTYNFRPVSPPTPCLVMPGAIAKGLSPIKLKPPTKHSLDNRVVLTTIQSRSKRPANHTARCGSRTESNKRSGFKEYTFILPSCYSCGKKGNSYTSTIALLDSLNNPSPVGTTDHYTHWCDNKSCSSRISSGNLKDNMLGNIEVPNLYTTVTPKSFLPPSPLRTKQFVMPLKLQQLEPQKKPGPAATTTDLTVTFVHRKLSDSTSKTSCHRTTGSTNSSSKQSKNSANSNKPTNKQSDSNSLPQPPVYPDPLENAPVAFVNRLAEMTSHQADTVRFERNKRGKNRTKIS